MLRIFRSVSAAQRGSVGKGDDLILMPRISKRQKGSNQEQQLRSVEGFSSFTA